MSCSLKFLLPVMILAIPVAALAQSKPRTYPNLGTPLNQADIQNFDRMIGSSLSVQMFRRPHSLLGVELYADDLIEHCRVG
jgi:hypothetical protein